jgi:hypothetical protein
MAIFIRVKLLTREDGKGTNADWFPETRVELFKAYKHTKTRLNINVPLKSEVRLTTEFLLFELALGSM